MQAGNIFVGHHYRACPLPIDIQGGKTANSFLFHLAEGVQQGLGQAVQGTLLFQQLRDGDALPVFIQRSEVLLALPSLLWVFVSTLHASHDNA